jgi:GT2 family glycosyltransferase
LNRSPHNSQGGVSTPLPRVTTIILNWNGYDDTSKCLKSLYDNDYPNFDVILIDNGSQDESVTKIARDLERGNTNRSRDLPPVRLFQYMIQEINKLALLPSEYENLPSKSRLLITTSFTNLGFCRANNNGIRFALRVIKPAYILLLNNDTSVDRKFLSELVKVAENYPRGGMFQSKVLSMGDSSVLDAVGLGLRKLGQPVQLGHREKDRGQYSQIMEVFGANGCSVLLRAKMLYETGLLDEDFFAYYDDFDLSWRAQLMSWSCCYVPTSVVYHKGSATGSQLKFYLLNRNKFLYLLKNAPLRFLFYEGVKEIISFAGKYDTSENSTVKTRAVIDSLRLTRKMIMKRLWIGHKSKIRRMDVVVWISHPFRTISISPKKE